MEPDRRAQIKSIFYKAAKQPADQRAAFIRSTRYFSPLVIALAHTGVGDKDGAFAWLTKAYESRDPQLIWIRVEPQLESLRSDPRFQSMLRRMGIPQ